MTQKTVLGYFLSTIVFFVGYLNPLSFLQCVLYNLNPPSLWFPFAPPLPPQGEEPPACFKLLRSLDLSKGLVGHTLHLCYRTSQIRPPAVAYTPELHSRCVCVFFCNFYALTVCHTKKIHRTLLHVQACGQTMCVSLAIAS